MPRKGSGSAPCISRTMKEQESWSRWLRRYWVGFVWSEVVKAMSHQRGHVLVDVVPHGSTAMRSERRQKRKGSTGREPWWTARNTTGTEANKAYRFDETCLVARPASRLQRQCTEAALHATARTYCSCVGNLNMYW